MKPLILALLLFAPQKSTPPEIIRLKQEFIRLTNEYKASLGKLLPFYENDVKRAEERLEQSKRFLAEGLIARTQVEENEHGLTLAKEKIGETKRLITIADEQIAALPSDEALIAQYKKDRAAELKAAKRSKRCSSWTLTAKQIATSNSVYFSYRFVCQN